MPRINTQYKIPFQKNNRKGLPYKFNYDEFNNFQSMEYNRPIKLSRALKGLSGNSKYPNNKILGVISKKDIMQRFLKDLEGDSILDTKVVGLAGRGSVAAAFETEDGKILKITNGNHFLFNRPVEDFDVPIYKMGHKNKTYYYLEEKCTTSGLNENFVRIIMDKIKEKGYKTYDLDEFDVHQIGFARDGKLYLLDHECAIYNPFSLKGLKKLLFRH